MAKLTLASLSNLQTGSAISALNNNFAAIATAMENTLSRDGTSPNFMSTNLDMNSYRISNLVEAISDTEPVRLKEFIDGMDSLEIIVQDIASTAQGYLNEITTIYDTFDDRYLGALPSDPSTDNDGNALLTGAIYWNTSTNIMKVWTGTQWVGVISTSSGFLLDDLADVTISSVATGDVLRWNGTQFVNYADTAYAPAVHTHTSAAITDFTEAAQDAAGAMVDSTLVYTDATPLLSRAALTGAITASAGSNSTSLGSFTMAQLDTAVSDGNVSYVGHTHTLANVTDVTMTVSNLNSLDDGVDSTLHFHNSDRSRANHTGTQTASTISDFNEAAQDAVGAAFDTTLTYNDAGNSMGRSALTGAITASAGSNSTALGSFTSAQLDAAVSDANVSYTGHTHTLANVTDVTMTVSNLNSLDDGVNSTLHFHDSDRSRANHTGTQTASTVSDFNEAAQDAVGGMVDTTLVYSDATPSLSRAALTGAITASAGSNSTSLGSFTMAQLDTAVSDGNVSYVGHTHTASNITDFSTAVTTVTDPLYQDTNAMLDDLAALTDPNADRILFWDDSAGQLEWLTIGTNLTITGTTLNASGGGGGGGLSDADYGDITVSSAGTVMTIDNDVVTYAKMQNVGANSVLARAAGTSGDVGEVALSASQLLGRGSTGDIAAITLGANLSMSGTTVNPTGVALLAGSNIIAGVNTFNGGTLTLTSSDSGASALPDLILDRSSSSPAANDDIGRVVFSGLDSGANYVEYAALQGTIIDPTNASEDGGLDVDLMSAGTLARRFRFEPEIRYGYNNAGANQGVSREEHWIKLDSDYALTNATTEQKIFNTTTNGRLTLGTGTYFFDAMLYILTMSGTSGNAAFDPIGGGTAVGASFLYHTAGIDNNTPTNAGTQTGSFTAAQQTVASMVSAGTGTGMGASIRGTFRITTAGTIIPSITLVTAAAATMKAGSYFRIWRAGDVSTYSVGAWD